MDFSHKIDRNELRKIFQHSFDPEIWKMLLIQVFGANKLYEQPKPRELDNGDNAKVQGYDLGEIITPDKYTIGLFQFEIKSGHKIPMNRVGLRGLVEKDIKYFYDAALVVYYNDTQWRLSFICDLRNEKTAPKRFTYVFGDPEQSYRTPISRFELIKSKGASKALIHEAFSVEQLNKDFFNDYKGQFRKFVNYLGDGKDTKQDRDYVKKLLGRLVFLQFLQKKGWMGVPTANEEWTGGDPNYLQNLIGRHKDNDRLLSNVLEPLFFNTLNNNDRKDYVADTILWQNQNIQVKIPYLNGGLFDGDSRDDEEIDFPYSYFAELADFFSAYNFTIDENDPDDSEVGIDPEMLGHIFENLLEDNKDKGAFYTPKEIVHYMCRESLVQYLCSHTGEELHDAIDKLVRGGLADFFAKNRPAAVIIDNLLREVKICDPAIGSGAFPMGLLSEIFHCRRLLYGHMKTGEPFSPSKIKREIIQENIYGVDIEQGAVDIARLRFWLSLVVDEPQPEPLPNLDYKIMQGNSLLESFEGEDLSVLYKDDEAVNDLFSVPQKRQDIIELQSRYFSTTNHAEKNKIKSEIDEIIVSHLENSLRQKRRLLNKQLEQTRTTIANFQAGIDGGGISKGRIAEYQKRIDKEKKTLTQLDAAKDNLDDKSGRLKAIDNDNRPFFLWHLFFKDVFDKGGFDIIIANPPYVSTKGVSEADKKLFEQMYGFADDTYNHFFFQGFKLLAPNGTLTYICPKTFWTTQTKRNLRELLLSKTIRYIFDTANPFQNAMVDTCIISASNSAPSENTILFLDGKESLSEPSTYTIEQDIYKNTQSSVIFKPTTENLKIQALYGERVKQLYNTWWEKISTSKNIEKNKVELEAYRKSLRPGDIALLGCLTEGGQGLATANNGKYIAVRKSTKWAKNILESRPKKLAEAIKEKKIRIAELANFCSPIDFLASLSEKEIAELFDNLKERYGRDIFGQGYIYRLIDDCEIANVDSLTEDEKQNGIAETKKYYVPYDKGDKDGNRWYLETPFAIAWTQKNVGFLKTNSGKKGEGMPVVRNPQFYFKEGFCWSDINTTFLKCRKKQKSINDVKSLYKKV